MSVPLIHLGFALDLWDRDSWEIALSDKDLDLLDTDIASKHFFVSRHLKDVFSVTTFDLPRRFQDVLNKSSRRLEDPQMFAGVAVCLKFGISDKCIYEIATNFKLYLS